MNPVALGVPSVNDLLHALSCQAIEPAFQPLIDLEQGLTIGVEVLARWNHPLLGAISPSFFIKLAEESGLIDDVTTQVMDKACAHLKLVDADLSAAFNLSPVQFRDESIVDRVCSLISSHGLPFSRIHIELTESALLDDRETAYRTARKFGEKGFGLALDDFGTGFSSLTRLHELPFNKLKIDASFVRQMDVDAASRKIVASVIDLGQSLGMTVVAEGVETSGQLAMLRRLGCDVGQGYFLGRPSTGRIEINPSYPVGSLRTRRTTPTRRQKLFQLEAIYKNAPNALAFLDCDGHVILSNERFGLVIGKPSGSIIGHVVSDLIETRRSDCVPRILRHLRGGREIRQLEILKKDDGKAFVVTGTRVVDDEGELMGISLSLMDVTRRKKAEALLRADERQARRLAGNGMHVVWAARPTGELYYMGPTITARRHVALEDRIADWYEQMHPDDRVRVRQEWLTWLPCCRPFATRFRVRCPSGDWRWLKSVASPQFDENGSHEDWLGHFTDDDT